MKAEHLSQASFVWFGPLFFGPLLRINSVWHSTGVFRFEKWNVIAWVEKRTQTQSGAPEPGPSRSLGQPEGGPVTWGHSWGACLSPSKTVQLSAWLLTAWVVTASPPGMVRAGRSHHLTACPFHSAPPASCRHCPLGHPRPFWGDLNSKELCQSLSLIISSHCCMALQYLVRRSLPFLFVNGSNGNVCQDQTHILSWLIIFSVFPPELIYMEGGKWRNR